MRSQLCQLCAAVPKHVDHIANFCSPKALRGALQPWVGQVYQVGLGALAQKDVNDTPKPSKTLLGRKASQSRMSSCQKLGA